jgi:thioredoxin reductase
MPLPARNTLAIVGAGPIGLEAAMAALDAGLDVHVFERGEVGAHPIAWGHVRMFTPWRMNLGPASRAHLERSGWTAPEPDALPTGLEYAERYLEPLARLPELSGRVHTHAQIVHIGRRGLVRSDPSNAARRREQPFRLLVRDAGGRENFLHAFIVIDASGVYGQPNWAGDGGIPARSEIYLAPHMSYHVDDVLDLRRARYAGKRTMVIGGGASAATVAGDLVKLAGEAPDTALCWVTRETADLAFADDANDPLAERRALFGRARALIRGEVPVVRHVGGAMVEGFEYNSATHRYRVALRVGEQTVVEEVDQVIVNTGFHPDDSLCRELQPDEPDLHVLGSKSRGRSSDFLIEAGFRQVAAALSGSTRELGAALPG